MSRRFRAPRARRGLRALLLAGALLGFGAPVLHAQKVVPILVGGVSGLAAGTYVSLGVVAAEARAGRYLNSTNDAFGFRSLPVLVGAGTGIVLGAVNDDRLYNAMLVSASAGAVGFGAGWLVGSAVWEDRGGKWAGAVIGSATGIVVGGVVGMLLSTDDDSQEDIQPTAGRGIPIGFTIRF